MRPKRILVPLHRDEVAPRFDLAGEALIADVDPGESGFTAEEYLLPQASAEGLCDLVLRKDVDVVVCGGIEEEYYHYLRWKRVEVLDNVAGNAREAIARFAAGRLKSGEILFDRGAGHAR
ncbi:hypothetical protein NNJEOMEG_01572 [Fundidesulfovibrio magnetotacticus]|uniref:Dinitrogenase iron-molybdenum cofactor biosynthesis domain-containing protein n=1 Tax=Fundidesulfovibrio magnetotacticus TaxID=2730080 RepID=A0A6V8LTT4_9BACT|nr:NifB/NifX family molybdenum-iron cluster-binding protein [Fundidesulfovibrio magnetotacticus]GFK93738.1 hypothetical protein NNJEOMEG_01572 [Fundidesulfovibrio magnetotacticus]